MQNCLWQCQSRNSGNVGNTDRAGFGWKWETESSHSDPLKVNLTKTWAGISFVKVCASEFVFENTPKWGSECLPPPQSISTAKTLAAPPPTPTVTSFSFPSQRRSVSLCACVASALLIRREAHFTFHINCVLIPTNRLEWYRDAWVVL